jgi:catechol 2,3-dioxygenase-like lactoylglutathione lyase family enzyme
LRGTDNHYPTAIFVRNLKVKETGMALTLNHYTIRTSNLDASTYFYQAVLGLTVGPRPDFGFPGAWLYRGDHEDYSNAVIHLLGPGRDKMHDTISASAAGDTRLEGTGAIDHIAFLADGLPTMLSHLKGINFPFQERTVPGLGLHQLFLYDPQGIKIELNYSAAEKLMYDQSTAK